MDGFTEACVYEILFWDCNSPQTRLSLAESMDLFQAEAEFQVRTTGGQLLLTGVHGMLSALGTPGWMRLRGHHVLGDGLF